MDLLVTARAGASEPAASAFSNLIDSTAFRNPLGGMFELNSEQNRAVCHGQGNLPQAGPLLVLAGAGTGKTATLAHRVAWLIGAGVAPDRLLLLTFSRRAAAQMVSRAGALLTPASAVAPSDRRQPRFNLPWAGTFHSVAAQLLRQHAPLLGLNPNFTIIDRGDSIDLLDWLREQQMGQPGKRRFPRAATCLAIYSDVTNTGGSLAQVLAARYPWCETWQPQLRQLMAAYVARKQAQALLDFDDLLLWWRHGLDEPVFAKWARAQFDHILVDEYQDSNRLQVELLSGLKPDGRGLFVVGDDAQSIYSFRGADVDHMYRFSAQFSPPASRIALQQNYRSTQSVLDTANALIAGAEGPFDKTLAAATKPVGARPRLVTVLDDAEQSAYLVARILERREQGVALREQAVLFRNGHHSDGLEIELNRHNIPFVKYGGLKFVEAAHIKDALALLRWAFNPRDGLAGFRCLQLVRGMGPTLARASVDRLAAARNKAGGPRVFESLGEQVPRGVQASDWAALCELLALLSNPANRLTLQINALAQWLAGVIEERYDNAGARLADLQMLESISAQFRQLPDLISALALDPPNASGAWGDDAHHDEDYLILSTVHSAKGQEWQSVYLLNVADGNFPNEFSTNSTKALAEERRLLYVGLTRARDHLELIEPMRYYLTQQPRHGGAHVYGARSRFLDGAVLSSLDCQSGGAGGFDRTGQDDQAQQFANSDVSCELDEICLKNAPKGVAQAIMAIWE